MTTEQITAAIAEATGNTPTNIDDAFITKIKEMNTNKNLKFWIGTQAQFEELQVKDANTLYIFTDDPMVESVEEIALAVQQLKTSLDGILAGTTVVPKANSANSAKNANYATKAGTAISVEENDYGNGQDPIETKGIFAVKIVNNGTGEFSTIFLYIDSFEYDIIGFGGFYNGEPGACQVTFSKTTKKITIGDTEHFTLMGIKMIRVE